MFKYLLNNDYTESPFLSICQTLKQRRVLMTVLIVLGKTLWVLCNGLSNIISQYERI
jgi:hypothetical protein